MLKKYVFVLITLGVVVTTLSSCRQQEVRADSKQDAVPVQVRTPAVVDRAEWVSASGSVEGSETADVAFLVGGRVARVYVEEGQQVKKGQLLAEIEATDYRNAFNAAVAQKEAALAIAEKADAGLRKQELEQARIDYDRAEDEYKRMKFLVERKSLPPNDFQKVEAAYNAAHERYQMALEGTRAEDRATALAKEQAAEAEVKEESKRLADTRLVAPISGSIAARKVDPGQSVPAGMSVFTIADLNPAKVRVGVPEAEITKVKLGAKAVVTLPSLAGQEFKGKVGIIGVSAEPTSRTYTVKIIVPNPGPVLLAGMVAESQIYGDARVHALTIPAEAIVHDPQGAPAVFVYFPDRHRVYAHNIEVGPPVGQEVEIRSGLRGGEQVVVAGMQKLRDGMPVEVAGGAR